MLLIKEEKGMNIFQHYFIIVFISYVYFNIKSVQASNKRT